MVKTTHDLIFPNIPKSFVLNLQMEISLKKLESEYAAMLFFQIIKDLNTIQQRKNKTFWILSARIKIWKMGQNLTISLYLAILELSDNSKNEDRRI